MEGEGEGRGGAQIRKKSTVWWLDSRLENIYKFTPTVTAARTLPMDIAFIIYINNSKGPHNRINILTQRRLIYKPYKLSIRPLHPKVYM